MGKAREYYLFLGLVFLLGGCSFFSHEKEEKEKRGEIYYSYGTEALVRKDYTLALDNFLKALDYLPKDSRLHNNVGMAYFLKQRSDKALEHFQKAIDLDKKNSDAKNNLGSLYFTQGKYAEAEKVYEDVANDLVYANQYRVYYNLGLIQLNKQDKLKAKYYFDKSVENNESYCPAHFQLGLLAFKDQVYELAVKHFQNASFGTCYEEPAPQLYLGKSYLKLEKLDLAKEKFLDLVQRFNGSQYALEANDYLQKLNHHEFIETKTFPASRERMSQKIEGLTNEGTQDKDSEESKRLQSPNF